MWRGLVRLRIQSTGGLLPTGQYTYIHTHIYTSRVNMKHVRIYRCSTQLSQKTYRVIEKDGRDLKPL